MLGFAMLVQVYFNPRTPCGVRPCAVPRAWGVSRHFNPRTPCGVRPGYPRRSCASGHFNPRTPCGVRHSNGNSSWYYDDFNPRTPCGVRLTASALHASKTISIHAPLAGCDSKIAEIFPADLRKSYKISAKPNKERRCRVLGKGKAAAISDLARCEPPGENRNASGSHQIMSAPSGA